MTPADATKLEQILYLARHAPKQVTAAQWAWLEGFDKGADRWIPQEPTARQRLFLDLSKEREVFYGGAAGGGKSSCLLMDALKYANVPGYSALLLRRTYADLSKPGALMDRAHQWLRDSSAKWNEQKKQWTFPSKATLSFGYLENENDKYHYQGPEYQYVGFDELTQFKESQYTYLFSRLRRLAGSDIPLRMRSASNPGGVGAGWVHERFIPEDFTPEMAREHVVRWKLGTDERGKATRRAFVPATLDDNPHLDRAEYAESLDELDDVTREQLLRGDWAIRERGNILSMWDERYHVISWAEFRAVFGYSHIPLTWLLGIYQDVGTTEGHPCVTSWLATAPEVSPTVNGIKMAGSVYLYRGLMVTDETPRSNANTMISLMSPHRERERMRRWQMSHEGASERATYRQEHGLPFAAWPTGKTRGIAQLRNALEIVDKNLPHPFRPHLQGHPKLYLVVNDDELVYAKTDAGLVRHRAEAPAYKWATLKSGEETTQQVPHALFNDAMDTMRAAAADYFPLRRGKTKEEAREEKLALELQQPQLVHIPDIKTLEAKLHSRRIHLGTMIAEEKQREAAAQRMVVPRLRFKK